MRLAILTYHSLDSSGSPVSVHPAIFAQHLHRLAESGYTVLPLGEALDRLSAPDDTTLGTRVRLAALTFDDGYASICDVAAPLLAEFGWRATLFAVTQYLGRANDWPGQPTNIPRAQLMTWRELQTLGSAGWEIGAHTRTHPDLTLVNDEHDLDCEVVGSKHDLEDRIGRAVDLFAYPSGRYNWRVRSVIRRHFRAACTTHMGWVTHKSSPDALERLEMWDFARPGTSGLLGSSLMVPYVWACRSVRSLKYP